MLSEKSNELYNKRFVEFIVEVFPRFINIKLEENELNSSLMQALALKVVEIEFSGKNINEGRLL